MSHFARVVDGLVTQVIVVEQDFIDTLEGKWIQTSYNTSGGKHSGGGVPLRKNFAGVGYTYDPVRDAFIPPQPFKSWTLDEDSCLWVAPVPSPGPTYGWDDAKAAWVEMWR